MNKAAEILSRKRIWPNHMLYGLLTGIAMAWPHATPEEQIKLNQIASDNEPV